MAASIETSTTGFEERARVLGGAASARARVLCAGLSRLALFGSTATAFNRSTSLEARPFGLFAFVDPKADLARFSAVGSTSPSPMGFGRGRARPCFATLSRSPNGGAARSKVVLVPVGLLPTLTRYYPELAGDSARTRILM